MVWTDAMSYKSAGSSIRPEPHALDYDWRFSPQSAERLCECLAEDSNVLLLGCPTLRPLLGERATLVDWNPLHQPDVCADLRRTKQLPMNHQFDEAVLDPPWYPEYLDRWLRLAGQHVRIGGSIHSVLWPSTTRPDAEHERDDVLATLEPWLRVVSHRREAIVYQTPLFERLSMHGRVPAPGRHRVGDVVEIAVLGRPPMSVWSAQTQGVWWRFVFAGRQLALRGGGGSQWPVYSRLPGSESWVFDTVSRRDSRRATIDLWTSTGIVAKVPDRLVLLHWLLDRKHQSDRMLGLLRLSKLTGIPVQEILSGGMVWTHHV